MSETKVEQATREMKELSAAEPDEVFLMPNNDDFELRENRTSLKEKLENTKNQAASRWKHRMHVSLTIILAVFVLLSACVAAYTYIYPRWKTTELVARIMAPASDNSVQRDCRNPCRTYTENYPTASASLAWYRKRPCPAVPESARKMSETAASLFGMDPSRIAFSCSQEKPYWIMGDTAAINAHLIVHALETPQDEFAYAPYAAMPAMAASGMSLGAILRSLSEKPMGSARRIPSRFSVQDIMVTAGIQQACAVAAAENMSAPVGLAAFLGCPAAPASG